MQDIRYALRTLRRSPGFTAIAVLSLALGIGANTAIFSLIDALLLRTLPVRDPGQLVELLHQYPGEPFLNGYSWQSYEHFRDHNHVFAGLIGIGQSTGVSFYVRAEGRDPERLNGQYPLEDFFSLLGMTPAFGRLLSPEDNQADSPSVAVMSWSYWNSRFNLDPRILGKQILIENVPVTIVGVTPRDFSGLQAGTQQDLWLPPAIEPRIHSGHNYRSLRLALLGRLKPGVSIEQARAEMAVLFQFSIEEMSSKRDDANLRRMKSDVQPAGAGLASRTRDQFARPLLLLMSVVALLLLIACTNLASMMLARGAARQREMALRVALGAGRWRLLRQTLTESLLLSTAGSLSGVLVAQWGADGLARIIASAPGLDPFALKVRPNTHVLLFIAAVAVLTGALFGLAPALNAFRTAPASVLRAAGSGGETRVGRLFGKSLVVAQMALSVVLLTSAVLFIRHLSNLEHLDLGFQRDCVLLVRLDRSHSGYDDARLSRLYQELLGRLESIPGVRSATLCAPSPLEGSGASPQATVEGYQDAPGERGVLSQYWIAPKYFETLGTPFLLGRDFNFDDQSQNPGRPRVAIINQTMARYYFGDRSPLGKHVKLDNWDHQDAPYEIVGVAGDTKYYEMREATKRIIYVNTFQFPAPVSQFAIRTSIDPAAVAPEVRRAIREVLKTVPVVRIRTLAEQVDATIIPERLVATLSACFGALGALLAAIGLYGLLAYSVARRTNEIGIRMALGATRSAVIRMVIGDALGMVCTGLAIGAPIALWAKSFAASLIEGLPANSIVPVAAGAAATIAIALLAAYVPAQRAARVDPMQALRYE